MILALLLSGFVAQLLAAVWIQISYSSNLPRVPDDKAGRICQIVVNHGSIRYGTQRELDILRTVDGLQPVAILLFLLAIVLGLTWGIFKIGRGRKLNE